MNAIMYAQLKIECGKSQGRLQTLLNCKVKKIDLVPVSETTAVATFERLDMDFRLLVFYYKLKHGVDRGWRWFIPTYDHFCGMKEVGDELKNVERYNHKGRRQNDTVSENRDKRRRT